MNKPTLTRSKFSEVRLQPSQANAAWDFSAQPRGSSLNYVRETPALPAPLPGRIAGYLHPSLPHQNGQQKIAYSCFLSGREESPTFLRTTRVRTCKPYLIDDDKMQKLLNVLHTGKFAGKIDMEHHSQYLEQPQFDIPERDTLKESRLCQSQGALRKSHKKSQFKEALKAKSVCNFSSPAAVNL